MSFISFQCRISGWFSRCTNSSSSSAETPEIVTRLKHELTQKEEQKRNGKKKPRWHIFIPPPKLIFFANLFSRGSQKCGRPDQVWELRSSLRRDLLRLGAKKSDDRRSRHVQLRYGNGRRGRNHPGEGGSIKHYLLPWLSPLNNEINPLIGDVSGRARFHPAGSPCIAPGFGLGHRDGGGEKLGSDSSLVSRQSHFKRKDQM